FKCPLRLYHGTEEIFYGLISRRTAALAKYRGLDVEAIEIDGDHNSNVPRAMMQSIAFFQRISGQEIVSWNGEVAALPKKLELDLGDGVKMPLVRMEPGTLLMGSPAKEQGRRDDEAQHKVDIKEAYFLGVHPVTQGQFRKVMGRNPSFFSPKGFRWDKVVGLTTD